ncbi:GDSL-type esterase/lipase family protein [Clostridium sp. B9]|uniref:GDSL-type esterase/lipase family protein n=1 Tax=Clostridium sp. B9 TaxID=3423224 RepID=UPI003D2F142F
MNILCIGDSLTFGYGVGQENSWVTKINDLNFTTINRGINGDTSTGILSRIYSTLTSAKPDVCVIMCGSNDILMEKSIESIIENIDLMIKDCDSLNIKPVLMSPPKIFGELALKHWDSSLDYLNINIKLESFSKELKMYSIKNNIKFIDITHSIPFNPSNYTDGLHISIKGNILIAELLKRELIFD